MLNYKRLYIPRTLQVLEVMLILLSILLYIFGPREHLLLFLYLAIGLIFLQYILTCRLFACPRCGSRHILTRNIFYYRPSSVFYCPDCGEELRFTPKGGGQG